MRLLIYTPIALLLLSWNTSSACLWDYDTLAMERQRFPRAHELIVGHFVRHSAAYYTWRISNRESKPLEQRTASDFDDIAVAYDKLNRHDDAIATIRDKIERWPNEFRYESEANLGTFHIHAGRMVQGLKHIERAIEINPGAHFGREVYQKLLAEYVIEAQKNSDQLPLSKGPYGGFAAYVITARNTPDEEQQSEIQLAAKGVMGMMRFGNHDSPILLEALGDLLLYKCRDDSKMLACRAYLRAADETDDAAASSGYQAKAERALEMQVGSSIASVRSDLAKEIAQGDKFFDAISQDEESWVASGQNLDNEFARKYYDSPLLAVGWPNWLLAIFVFSLVYMVVSIRRRFQSSSG